MTDVSTPTDEVTAEVVPVEPSEPIAVEAAPAPASAPSPTSGGQVLMPEATPKHGPGDAAGRSLDLLHGVEMTVTVELGRTKMPLGELLALQTGSVIELDRTAGSPVDVLINDNLLARGEVVVLDDEFGVRILDIVSPENKAARH